MKLKHIVTTAAICTTGLLTTTFVVHADDKAPPEMDPAAMQKMWMEYGMPGPEHQEMAKRVGTWEMTFEDFSQGTPTTSKGIVKRSMLLNGLYMREDVEASFNWDGKDYPFIGMGTLGYDKGSKEYFYFWIDSMGCGYSFTNGKASGGNSTEMAGEMTTPMGKLKTRVHVTMVDDDTDTMEMYSDMNMDGTEEKCMKLTYKRKS